MVTITAKIATIAVVLLLALNVLTTPHQQHAVSALPITSKPIENTAENLAWQAWLMLPPEVKSQEKSRKVTPKSIFTLPFRECPPGHQLYQSRCIPTVTIDQNELLTQQLLGFVVGDSGADNNYEFDYDDEEPPVVVSNESAGGKASGSTGGGSGSGVGEVANYDDAAQLPSQDEPLKFNIFQQKFPTSGDYDAAADVGASLEGSGGAKVTTTGADSGSIMPGIFNTPQFLEALNGYLERQASAANGTQSQSASNSLSDQQAQGTNVAEQHFAISDIDAIVVPASSPAATIAPEASNLEPQKFSLFKDDSALELVTAPIAEVKEPTATTTTTTVKTAQPDLSQLLKADALLPLLNHAATTATSMTGAADSKATTQQQQHGVGATTMPLLSELLDEAESATQPKIEKEERTRSVTAPTTVEELAIPLEEESLTSTFEPLEESTTHIQVDETTIIEAHDPPTIELQELQAQHERHASEDATQAKTKVEPVEGNTETTTTDVTTATTPLPRATHSDRFSQTASSSRKNNVGSSDSSLMPATTTSEINIEQELRLINELVKGKRHLDAAKANAVAAATLVMQEAAPTTTITTTIDVANELAEKKSTTTTTTAATATSASSQKAANAQRQELLAVETTTIAAAATKCEVVTTVESADSSTSTATTASAATEPTSTIWSKIMPIFGFGQSAETAAGNAETTTTATEVSMAENELESSSDVAASTSSSSSLISSNHLSSNRSNRNSKIIRLPSVSLNALSDSAPAAITTTTEAAVITTTTVATTAANDPFWWLPLGWRLDRQPNDEQHLLLRFWNAFPESQHNQQAKVQP